MKYWNLILGLSLTCQNSPAQEHPNILVIMVDDMGYSDIGCYGSEIETPNLDRLASHGIRFSQFYNTSRCCPSRACLLTGLDHHKAGMGLMTGPRTDRPGYRGHLVRDRCTTIPELLGESGYGTYMVGKWHLGLQPGERPLDWGFDRFYGALEGAISFFEPGKLEKYPFDKVPRYITLDNDTIIPDPNFYATNRFTDYARLFMDQHLNERENDPFFLYVAYNAPHWPLQALPKDIQKYSERYQTGWDAIREERYQKQLNTGLLREENTELTERTDGRYKEEGAWPNSRKAVPPWNTLDEELQEDLAKRMAVYAAMVDNIDQNVGRLIEFLEEKDILDNTLILFLSDNGGALGGALRGYNALGNRGELETYGTTESFISYGVGWANASNTPFRMYKCYVHEGGISSPLIAHWPSGMLGEINRIERTPAHITDIMPTLLDVANTEYPEKIGERDLSELQGKSILPLLQDQQERFDPERILFWEHAGSKAVRYGKWKIVKVHKGDWELYDFDTDRCETINLIEKHPDIAKKLMNAYEQWAEENYVNPPLYD